MKNYICATCGVQFSASEQSAERCAVCEDERQYIGWNGQRWTTLDEIQQGYHNIYKNPEPDLTEIGTEPVFAIGQRALLIKTYTALIAAHPPAMAKQIWASVCESALPMMYK